MSQTPWGDGSPLQVVLAGNSSGNSAVTIADGADIALGAVADAAANAAGAGTVSAKLRTVTSQLSNVGATTDAAVTDSTANASVVAALKGVVGLLSGQLSPPGAIATLYNDGNGTYVAPILPPSFQDCNGTAVTTTGNSVWTPTAGRMIRLMGGSVSFSVAAMLEFRDGAANGTVLFRTPMLAANTAYNFPPLGNGQLGTVNSNLVAVASANGSLTGTLIGAMPSA